MNGTTSNSASTSEFRYYPGSTVPIQPVGGPPDPLRGLKGEEYEVRGRKVELFTISQLAYLLNRKPGSIRRWELDGVIPKATFAKSGTNKDPRGRRRLYSKDQVLALIKAAQEEGILNDLHRQVSKTRFKAKVWAEFRRLAK